MREIVIRYLHDYFFWLVVISIACFVLERIHPWRVLYPSRLVA